MPLRVIGLLLCTLLMGTARANAPAMKCVQLPSTSVLCDDQEKIYYRAAGTEAFVALDRETAYSILEYFARLRERQTPAEPAAAQREA